MYICFFHEKSVIMKIGILTQPLGLNYGGIMQAYALQKVLQDGGHEVITLNYWRRVSFKTKIKRALSMIFWGSQISLSHPFPYRKMTINTEKFIKDYINYTDIIFSPLTTKDVQCYNFDAYIVGSDQVWRESYSPYLPTFFLDFISDKRDIKRVAYAASFGTSDFDCSPDMLSAIKFLVNKFDVISVREDSAIDIVKKYFQMESCRVLDPTMLLNSSDYCQLINNDLQKGIIGESESANCCCSYLLNESAEKIAVVNDVLKTYRLNHYSPIVKKFPLRKVCLDECQLKPVTEWLRMFYDSKIIVTDSFHGTVFSIIFKKQFIVLENHKRGQDRLLSLLKMFDLEDRLFSVEDKTKNLSDILNKQINWEKVDAIISMEREKSLNFIRSSLNG